MKPCFYLFLLFLGLNAHAQTSYNPVRGYWDHAGYPGLTPQFPQVRDIRDFGADPSGAQSCNHALEAAIADLHGAAGTILFPGGEYRFDAPVTIDRDSIVLRGAGYDSSLLRFDLGAQLRNCIMIAGGITADTSLLGAAFLRGDSTMTVDRPELFKAGDWINLSINDAAFMSSTWAYGTLGQTAQIRRVQGNTIYLSSRARFNYRLELRPRIRKINPRMNVGIECLGIQRMDATAGQTSGIVYDRAVNCWISGIASDKANFAHIELNRSAGITIRNSYIHDAFAYGGGGQGYGVLLQTGSNECLVTGNYFHHLRHSMILQSGANGNVLSYNYSTKPYWTEPNLPDSSAGEIVLHGNYPFMNLAEGNVLQNIVIDDSHGANGPLNTFFRNRAMGYGVFMNFSQPTDSQQFIGNEVTNGAIGMYFMSGRGHLQYANNVRGTITGNTGTIPEQSLYLSGGDRPECSEGLSWPAIGEAGQLNAGTIPTVRRVNAGYAASCGCIAIATPTAVATTATATSWQLAPNPASGGVEILGGSLPEHIAIYDASGRLQQQLDHPRSRQLALGNLPAGLYFVRLQGAAESVLQRLVIAR